MKLWLAQGFGAGRAPFAPGTFGAAVGLIWFGVLVWPGNLALFALGTLVGLGVSVWLCGYGERVLNQKDPGSVVLDEISAMPICYTGWITAHLLRTGSFPGIKVFVSDGHWVLALLLFGLFRLFDIWKPWPVRQSQILPGGWGITIDDWLAALYVGIISGIMLLLWRH